MGQQGSNALAPRIETSRNEPKRVIARTKLNNGFLFTDLNCLDLSKIKELVSRLLEVGLD